MAKQQEKENSWTFPDIASSDEDGNYDNQNAEAQNVEPVIRPEDLEALKNEYEQKIEGVKAEYTKKVDTLNNMFTKVDHPLTVLDNDIISLIQTMIKKITKTLIYKEIQSDPKIIENMIEELKKLLPPADSTSATLFLSETDHGKLNIEGMSPDLFVTVDPSLTEGDIIIKSNLTEVQAIMADRIEQLLGARHA